MDRHRVGEGPDHGARLGVAVGRAAVLDRDPLDAAREIGLPVGGIAADRLDRGPLVIGEIGIPAQRLEHLHGELGVAVLDLRADRI
jgi:hypothetical protein